MHAGTVYVNIIKYDLGVFGQCIILTWPHEEPAVLRNQANY